MKAISKQNKKQEVPRPRSSLFSSIPHKVASFLSEIDPLMHIAASLLISGITYGSLTDRQTWLPMAVMCLIILEELI
jgi:hypothetical protein